MNEPVVLRCRSVVVSQSIGVALLWSITIGLPVYLLVNGTGEGTVGILLGTCLYAFAVAAAVHGAAGLRGRIIMDGDGIVFVEPYKRVRMDWDEIEAMTIRPRQGGWFVDVVARDRKHHPWALTSFWRLGRRPPRSMRRAVTTMEREWQTRRAGSRRQTPET